MSSVSAPFGFRASYHNSGQIIAKAYTIVSGYAQNVFQGDPVKLVDTGSIQLGSSDGTRSGTTDGVLLLGISLVANISMLLEFQLCHRTGLVELQQQKLQLGFMTIQKFCLQYNTTTHLREPRFKQPLVNNVTGLSLHRVDQQELVYLILN